MTYTCLTNDFTLPAYQIVLLHKHRWDIEKIFHQFKSKMGERKIVRRMFDAGPDGFTGGMNAREYVALTGASKATATRDLQQLAQLGALVPLGGGRSTRYELGEP